PLLPTRCTARRRPKRRPVKSSIPLPTAVSSLVARAVSRSMPYDWAPYQCTRCRSLASIASTARSMGKRERVNAAASTELSDDLDLANDGFVERPNIFSRNPVFPMLFAAGLLHLIAI